MFPFIILFTVWAVIKAFILQSLGGEIVGTSHPLLLIPDLLYCATVAFWLLKIRKIKVNLPVIGWFAAYFGSVLWDFQPGYELLKIFVLPGLLVLILHT